MVAAAGSQLRVLDVAEELVLEEDVAAVEHDGNVDDPEEDLHKRGQGAGYRPGHGTERQLVLLLFSKIDKIIVHHQGYIPGTCSSHLWECW